jgi:hypothetical protein
MFMHSCCCEPGNPAICDPFEDDCPSTVLWGPRTKCQATVDYTVVCPPWCAGGVDIGPIDLYKRRSIEIEFDQCVLTRVVQGNTRFFRGQGRASVKVEEAAQIAREKFEDCFGGQTILFCSPYQASYNHEVDMKIILLCDFSQVYGTFEQFIQNPCVEQPRPDDIGYVVAIASSCFSVTNQSRFYKSIPTPSSQPGIYECTEEDAYMDAPRSGWAWYAYYRKGDCIIRQSTPLVWKPLYGGFANWSSTGTSNPAPCFAEGTVFTSQDSDFAVRRTATGCDFDWERNLSWSSVYPGSCQHPPFATFGEVPTCAQVLSGSCQQTSVQMDIPTIT